MNQNPRQFSRSIFNLTCLKKAMLMAQDAKKTVKQIATIKLIK